jgi:hypothetical protein
MTLTQKPLFPAKLAGLRSAVCDGNSRLVINQDRIDQRLGLALHSLKISLWLINCGMRQRPSVIDYGAKVASIYPPAALGTTNVTVCRFGSGPAVRLV